jgi:aminoglycoside 6'-N-acetyltransferase I
MRIRPIRGTDLPELVRMRQELWPDSLPAEAEKLLRTAPEDLAVFVAELPDGRLAGFAEVGTRDFADGCLTSPVAYLEGIWVSQEHRRSGIGAALVRRCQEWARGLGLVELASDCEIENEGSRAFHQAAGFTEVQRSVNFRLDLGADPN